jgi:cytochrome c-type biogenesis protein CcmH
MLLWLTFALLTAAVLAAVLAPLVNAAPEGSEPGPEPLGASELEAGRGSVAAPEASPEPGAVAVYRHQLAEIEAERSRGLIGAAEADSARLEISRRLLEAAASDRPRRPRVGHGALPVRRLALAVAAGVPALVLAVYLTYGAPDLPGFPHTTHVAGPLAGLPITDLIAKVEARLRQSPEDGEGWDVIAPVYYRLGRFADAAHAYARAAALKGENVKRLAGFAESAIRAGDGIVSEEARMASEKILNLEPGRADARFWLALAKEQDGDRAGAIAEFKSLLQDLPPTAPWREALEAHIEEASGRRAGAEASPRGPSAADISAAQQLSPDERAKMITAMVDGLAQRLKADGKDLSGWLRLLNAYVVLGRKADADAALADARRNFAGDDKALAALRELAQSLGLGS